MSAVTLFSTGFTRRWGSACIPRVFTPVEAVSPPDGKPLVRKNSRSNPAIVRPSMPAVKSLSRLELSCFERLTSRRRDPHNSSTPIPVTRPTFLVASTVALLTISPVPRAQEPAAPVVLSPTNHPRLPLDLSQLWLAPPTGRRTRTPLLDELASAIKQVGDGDYARALPVVSKPSLRAGTLGMYADYYKGLAELRLGRADQARRTFQAMQSRELVGFLVEAAALREAEAGEALGDYAAALQIYERLLETRTTAPDEVLMRLGRAAKISGDEKKANRSFARVYYEYPFSDFAVGAGQELDNGPFGSG